jgi:cobalamin biosynthesis protein CobT
MEEVNNERPVLPQTTKTCKGGPSQETTKKTPKLAPSQDKGKGAKGAQLGAYQVPNMEEVNNERPVLPQTTKTCKGGPSQETTKKTPKPAPSQDKGKGTKEFSLRNLLRN